MRQIIVITYLCIGAGLILPLFGQNKQDYHWVMGYNGQNPHPSHGGTHWVFDEDSLRLIKVDQEANFYLTDASVADPQTGELLLYSNGCAVYDKNGSIVANGDSINYGDIWKVRCPSLGYSHAQGGLWFRNKKSSEEASSKSKSVAIKTEITWDHMAKKWIPMEVVTSEGCVNHSFSDSTSS